MLSSKKVLYSFATNKLTENIYEIFTYLLSFMKYLGRFLFITNKLSFSSFVRRKKKSSEDG